MGTYRADGDLIDTAVACAAERGETVTNVIIDALQAYIRGAGTGEVASAPPADAPPVYTPLESPERYEEPREVPPCRHPAGQVDPDAGVCRECGADVF
jgi:hypothetical protein